MDRSLKRFGNKSCEICDHPIFPTQNENFSNYVRPYSPLPKTIGAVFYGILRLTNDCQ